MDAKELGVKADLKVEILKILLKKPHGTDISIRQIGKKLNRPSSHIHYYLKKMHEQGVLTREEEGDKVIYKPQAIFGRDIKVTFKLLSQISSNIDDATDSKLANCISLFLKLHS